MSGIEIAGLVLGGFPIVMSAWDMYKEQCQPFREWWRFEKSLSNLLRPVVCEEEKFRLNLEELLLPIVDSQEDLQAMCSNADDPRWTDPELDEQLRERLGRTYSIYFDYVADMQLQLGKIGIVLGVEDGNTQWLTNPKADWKNEYKRLVACFKKKKTEKYTIALEKANKNISDLLLQEQRLGVHRQHKRSPVGSFLQKVRSAATNLHSALSKGWLCQCSAPHSAILRLEARPTNHKSKKRYATHDEDLHFQLLFYHPQSIQVVTCASWTETKVLVRSSTAIASSRPPVTTTPLAEVQQKMNTLSFGLSVKQKKLAFASLPQKTTTTTGQPSNTNAVPISSTHITNLCQALHGGAQDTCVGYITQEDSQYYLTQWKNYGQTDSLQALDQMLGALTIPQRMQLAVAVASNVLQLWGTPWAKRLDKQDVQVWSANQAGMHAYVQAIFSGSAPNLQLTQPVPQRSITVESRETMLRLAIVLLELCFGERLETQAFRRNYLGPDGQPSDLTDRMTAVKWQEQVMGRLGEKYANVVSSCLDCRFWLTEPNLDDDTFRQSVHANVVEPLQEIASVLS